MRWIAIFSLGVACSLFGGGPLLSAQDQLVRPARVYLAPAGEPQAAESTASGQAAPVWHVAHDEKIPEGPEAESRPHSDSLAIPLKRSESGSARQATRDGLFGGPVATITGGLAITLGVFAIVVVLARRGGGVNLRGLPREAFEVIGQTSIGPRQRLMVVRVGTQALVIGTSPAGIHPIAQFDDPDEAGQLIAQCRGTGAQAAFKSTMYELEHQRTAPGFVDEPPTKSGNLFLRA